VGSTQATVSGFVDVGHKPCISSKEELVLAHVILSTPLPCQHHIKCGMWSSPMPALIVAPGYRTGAEVWGWVAPWPCLGAAPLMYICVYDLLDMDRGLLLAAVPLPWRWPWL
jgi:hypothetical protein